MDKYKTDCLFLETWLDMAGTFYSCTNTNKDELLFPNCKDCKYYKNLKEVRENIMKLQGGK